MVNLGNKLEVYNMITEKPYISIIIPVLNGQHHVENCMQSIRGLNYPKDSFEVILIDNGSNDKTVELIKKSQHDLDIKIYYNKIKSSYASRNIGIKNAKGEIIAFTDIDCIVDNNWLTNIVKYFSDKNIGGIAGEILPQKGNSLVERYSIMVGMLSQKITISSEFLPYAQTANAAYRKELFQTIGLFDELFSGGDADLSWRMQLNTDLKLVYAPDVIVLHKHRTDLKGLFKQTFRYGYGHVSIYEKYKGLLDNKNKDKNKDKNKVSYFAKMNNYLIYIGNDFMLLLPCLIYIFGYNLGKIYGRYTIVKRK